MNRNLKLIVVLGAAVLALAAMAPAASAWKFHHEEKSARTTFRPDGKNPIFWTFSFSKAECQEAGEGLAESLEETEEVITPTSDECTMGGEQVKPLWLGCRYQYTSGLVNFIGTMSIVCPPGVKMKWEADGCTITVGEQKGLSAVTFKNIVNGGKNPEREITVEINVTKLKYEEDNVAPDNTCVKPGVPQENGSIEGPEIHTDENSAKEMRGTWVA
jgi:hypothetical protein